MSDPIHVLKSNRSPTFHDSQLKPSVRRPTGSGPVHSVFIGNLSWDVTPELIEDMLADVIGPGLFTQGEITARE